MYRHLFTALVFSLASFAAAASAQAQIQAQRCADCHFARPDAPGQDHLADWDRSQHGRNSIGCQNCHDGDASTFEPFLAHRDILSPADPKSPLHATNIPATCGSCHVGPFVSFQDSRHFELLQAGNTRVATCVTCHGAVDGRALSPKALESRCNTCHGPDATAPRAERAAAVRLQYEGLSVVREQLKLANQLIGRVQDTDLRAELEEEYQQAEVPLTRAIESGHKFVYDDLQSNLDLAQTRAEALLSRLANQGRQP